MPFLFNNRPRCEAKYLLQDTENDSVLVGHSLWSSLVSESHLNRLCIALKPVQGAYSRRYPSLVCWALPDDKVDSSSIAIPPTWIRRYKDFFLPGTSLSIFPTEPITLTEVILIATSQHGYTAATDQDSLFDPWFNQQTILRQGDTLSIPTPLCNGDIVPTESYTFTIEATESVLQGCIKKGVTRIIVLSNDEEDDSSEGSVTESTEDLTDVIEIDSNFLANSALSKPLNTRSASSDDRPIRNERTCFTGATLPKIISAENDDTTLYLRTSDLGKLGVLNFDWAVAGNSASQYRLVRVVVDDSLVESSGTVKTSPILLFNITRSDQTDFTSKASSSQSPSFQLLPSPFGSHRPFIPTARAITIARVASPFSINKVYQDSFLAGLKAHFDQTQRLVKQGDIIAVPIEASRSRWVHDADDAASNPDSLGPLPLDSSSNKHTLVYFMITNVEYDILDTSSPSHPSPQDLYLGGQMGELGCWVDPSVTRIMQTGIEHSRIPDPGSYYDLERKMSSGILKILEERDSSLLAPSSPFGKLLAMATASMTKWSLDCHLDLTFLIKGQRGVGKYTTISWVAQKLGIHIMELDCYDLIGENDTKTEGTLRVRFDQATQCSPCIIVLRKLEAFAGSTQPAQGKESPLSAVLQECVGNLQKSWKETGFPVIVVGTVTESGQVPPSILSQFKHEINIEVPDERSRYEILASLLHTAVLSSDVSLSHLATQTAALVAADLVDLVARAHTHSLERTLKNKGLSKQSVQLAGVSLSAADFESALGKARDAYSESIGAPKIPTVSWDDVGGLAHVKADILDTIQLPLEHPELFADGLKKRSGILLYGPPGTGKTLIAKAVATSCSLNFFSVKGPELLNMYIGESEANVRRVFQKARDAKPCVIFFDELDSVAPKRGNQGDSGGVMDRIVSQLLAELDGMAGSENGSSDVFVIGATNRPDLLDPALLRPGRFDRMLYLGVSDTHEAQFNILEALTRKFRLDPDLNLRDIAEQCPFNYTGADFYALCSDAMLNAMSRKAALIDKRISEITESDLAALSSTSGVKHPYPLTPQYYLSELATPEEILVTVTKEDFMIALKNLVPSVSEAEMEHYRLVQQRFTQDKD
ncbi:valosin-containing protein [Coprinopsis cinerea AmutBmut pab1-1]|nr:valosin-containing protein [Coprinopsis cinerea AmutBmut pab1-1]